MENNDKFHHKIIECVIQSLSSVNIEWFYIEQHRVSLVVPGTMYC